jgi:hypothetical protein
LSAECPSNISPSPSKIESEVSVSHSGIYLKLAHFPVKIGLIGGIGRVPYSHGILIFLLPGSPSKISEPYDMPF